MTEWLQALGQDLRYAVRGLRKSPGFALVATLTLAIGVSANTTIFSAVDSLLLRPLPYPDQDRLVMITNSFPNHREYDGPVSDTDVALWKTETQAFEQLEFTSSPDMVGMSQAGVPERVGLQHVSPGFFPMMGVGPFLGSIDTYKDFEKSGYPGGGVVLSYDFWQRHFASDPKVLGRSLFVDNYMSNIGAVLNPNFNLFGTHPAEMYGVDPVPDPGSPPSGRWLIGLGKLKHGVSLQQAQASMDVVARHLGQAYPALYKDVGIRVEPLQQGLFGWSKQILFPLFGAVAFVLLIACVNVANLLLVRGEARRQEIGVRIALGANRTRLLRQLLTESILLALLGGACGLILTFWGLKLFEALSPIEFPRRANVAISMRMFLFTFGTCIFTGLVFGLIPALRAANHNVNDTLRESGRSTASVSRHRTQSILVVAEIAVALVLLVCAGLMINTLSRIVRTSPGFNPDHLVTAEIRLTGLKYIDVSDHGNELNEIQPAVQSFCQQLLQRVKSIAGVDDAALADWLPLAEDAQHPSRGFTITGQPAALPSEHVTAMYDAISPDYFRVMSIPVLKGRGLTEQDSVTAPWVVVINEAMARAYWSNENPIGRVITFDTTPDEQPRQIVGIVGNVKQRLLTRDPAPEAYVALGQQSVHSTAGLAESRVHKSLVIRSRLMSPGLMESVRKVVNQLADDSPMFGVMTVQQMVSDSERSWSFFAQLLSIFASVALLLAALGIYGVISYSVSQRSHEIGLRMALGAQPVQLVGLILRQAMTLSLAGLLLGLGVSFAVTTLLVRFLYGVTPHDIPTLAVVSLVLMTVTFFASYLPARRVTKTDPMQTLRHE
jgi:putative ABC transport system permease protein